MIKKTYAKTKNLLTPKEDGFSLPELMAVIIVFGILSAIAIPIFLNSQKAGQESDVDAALLAASSVVESEKAGNNGLYPTYMPKDAKSETVAISYTYNDSRHDYCLKGVANGFTKYIGSNSNSKVTAVSCVYNNVGTPQPGDEAADGGEIVNNHQPAISSISPATIITRKAATTTITVNGVDFLNGASILWDGVQITGATVVSQNKITFVSPGNPTYATVNIQVKNPNGRTSLPVPLNIVNPITVAPGNAKPATPVIANPALTATMAATQTVTLTSSTTACTVSDVNTSAPEYFFRLTQNGASVNTTGLAFAASDGKAVSTWRTSPSITVAGLQTGNQYSFTVETRCALEGQTGLGSTISAPKQFIPPIAKPDAPKLAPTTTSASPYLINNNITVNWSAYNYGASNLTCPAPTSAVYKLYDGSALVYEGAALTSPAALGATVRTALFTTAVYCKSNYVTSEESNKSAALNIGVINKPNKPAPVIGLKVASDNGTTLTFSWSPVTCNIGTAEYSYTANGGGTATQSAGWVADTTSIPTATKQGYDSTFTLKARCNWSGTASDESDIGSLSATSKVLAPTGAWTYNASNGTPVSHAFGPSCTADAVPQYRAKIIQSSRKSEQRYGDNAWHITGWGDSSHISFADKLEVGGVFYRGDHVATVGEVICKSSRTDKTVLAAAHLQAPVIGGRVVDMVAAWNVRSAFAVNPWKHQQTQIFYIGADCTPGSYPVFAVTNNKTSTRHYTAAVEIADYWNHGNGDIYYWVQAHCRNNVTGLDGGWSGTHQSVVLRTYL